MSIDLLWEIPLAIASFLFYKIMKFFIGNLYTLYLIFNQKVSSQWRVLSEENLKSPLSIPVLMTKGPRWNTHAVIGTLGPFTVQESLSFDLDSINSSAGSWIVVIYDFPAYRTITSLSKSEYSAQQGWFSLKLPPGKYSLGVRYYNYQNSLVFPAVKTDQKELVTAYSVPSDVNKFYAHLIEKKNLFYLALHYYIYTILRLKKWLPESFVRAEYLPVGAPDTQFFYDFIRKGESLEIRIDPVTLPQVDVYVTLYDRSSLPVATAKITSLEGIGSPQIKNQYCSQPMPSNGYYLVRVRHQNDIAKLDLVKSLQINKI